MKLFLRVCVAVLVIATLVSSTPNAVSANFSEAVAVTNLETNATAEPLGIDDPTPRFTWRLTSDSTLVRKHARSPSCGLAACPCGKPLAFRSAALKQLRLGLKRRSRQRTRNLYGKPEAFRTGSGEAAHFVSLVSFTYRPMLNKQVYSVVKSNSATQSTTETKRAQR